jgi:hydroxyethylthiazole kinase
VTKGVEAAEVKADLLTTAQTMARARNLTVVVTGKEDIVTDGATAYLVRNGHAMMSSIVGTGCMAASVIGAFASVECDYPLAAASALVCFGIAGELAAPRSQGPGTFKEHFFDALYNLDRETIDRMARVEKREL